MSAAMDDLLRRIAEWDMMSVTADGPYWLREIARVRGLHSDQAEAVIGSEAPAPPDTSGGPDTSVAPRPGDTAPTLPATIYVKVATHLLGELREWSAPVRVMAKHHADDTYELVLKREVAP